MLSPSILESVPDGAQISSLLLAASKAKNAQSQEVSWVQEVALLYLALLSVLECLESLQHWRPC